MMNTHLDQLSDFYYSEAESWNPAHDNIQALSVIERKKIDGYSYPLYVQYNPAREISTMANVSKEVIRERPCFLCPENRPKSQKSLNFDDNFEILINPFPILPFHLTIAAKNHIPQKKLPYSAFDLALKYPGLTVFFNGAKAGASIPDHLHLQAVRTEDLPLLKFIEKKIRFNGFSIISDSDKLDLASPFLFFTGILDINNSDYHKNLETVINLGGGRNMGDRELANYFIWTDNENYIRYLVIPRKAHRPECYFKTDEERLRVSPGAIDMAGVIVTPFKEDFLKINKEKIDKIYSQVAFTENE